MTKDLKSSFADKLNESSRNTKSSAKWSLDSEFDAQVVKGVLDDAAEAEEIETVTFGLETDDDEIIKVYVNLTDADEFEKALGDKLGSEDNIETLLDDLSQDYDIVSVIWPDEIEETDAEDEAVVPSDDKIDLTDEESQNTPGENEMSKKTIGEKFLSKYLGENAGEAKELAASASSMNPDLDKFLEEHAKDKYTKIGFHVALELGIPLNILELAVQRHPALVREMKIKMRDIGAANRTKLTTAFNLSLQEGKDEEEDVVIDAEWEVEVNDGKSLTLQSEEAGVEAELDYDEMLDLIQGIGANETVEFKDDEADEDDEDVLVYAFKPDEDGAYILCTGGKEYRLSKDTIDSILTA